MLNCPSTSWYGKKISWNRIWNKYPNKHREPSCSHRSGDSEHSSCRGARCFRKVRNSKSAVICAPLIAALKPKQSLFSPCDSTSRIVQFGPDYLICWILGRLYFVLCFTTVFLLFTVIPSNCRYVSKTTVIIEASDQQGAARSWTQFNTLSNTLWRQ